MTLTHCPRLHPQLQAMFTTVAEHLIRQAAVSKCYVDRQTTICAFRGENGTACAVGCLFPDAVYDPRIEGVLFDLFEQDAPHFQAVRDHLEGLAPDVPAQTVYSFLRAVQGYHDADSAYQHDLALVACDRGELRERVYAGLDEHLWRM